MTDNRTTELLPCPFCGGEASKRLFYGTRYGVYCDECDARVGGLFNTEAEAIAAWNARAERGGVGINRETWNRGGRVSDETTLLPCPFCGGEAYIHEHYSFPGYERKGSYPNYEPIGYAVGCMTFDCRGKRENTGFMYRTEAEAIATWNARAERGTLTADDIRDLIERHSDESGGNGRDFHNGAYVAIADELNARAERTCHNTHENRWFKCSACGYGFTDLYAEDESDINEQPRYCPNCGCKAVDA